jgi:hypothetical protein
MDVMQALFGQQNPAYRCAAGFSDSPHLFYSGFKPDGEFYLLYQIGFGGVPARPVGDGPEYVMPMYKLHVKSKLTLYTNLLAATAYFLPSNPCLPRISNFTSPSSSRPMKRCRIRVVPDTTEGEMRKGRCIDGFAKATSAYMMIDG